jgi:very-short-patch-repair endonuclease
LIIEVDGGQHNIEIDQKRTEYLNRQGFQILRFWNNEVLQNKEGVYDAIERTLNAPSPNPLPQGARALDQLESL